jgi:lysyl-tRNA synthetase class 2
VRFVIVASDIDNTKVHSRLVELLNEAAQSVRSNTALESMSHPRIQSWREAFTKLNLNPVEVMPSVQALVLRAKRPDLEEGKPVFAYHNTLVALSNYISLKHLIPSGVDDLGLVQGDFGLRPARGNEIFVGFTSNRVEHPEPGEIVLADKRRVMCRYWVWQQGIHTSVSQYTNDAAINIDILSPVTPEQGEEIARELSELVQEFTGAKVKIFKLDKNNPTADIETPQSTFKETVFDVLETRGYIQQTSDRAEVRRLLSDGTTVYQGFDPTRPSLHVGHLMSLMVFHYLQEAGNKMIFILGGGTAQVGDPSGRSKSRQMITAEEVAQNAKAVKAQVQKMGLIESF